MKKRLLALILAGILTASLSSCIYTGKKPEKTGPEGTEPHQTQNPTNSDPSSLLFEDRDEAVYVTASSLNLRQSTASTAGAIQVSQFTKLRRVKYSQTWSVVEHEGKTYYAASEYLTNEDLMAENFTACDETVMYANSNLNLRQFPSAESYSPKKGAVVANDQVIVVARSNNTTWVKIKNPAEDADLPFVFVNSKYLSTTPVGSGTVDLDALQFKSYDPAVTMYVTGDQLKLRNEPSLNGDEVGTLVKGNAVIVVAVAQVADADGITWARLSIPNKVEAGDPQTYSTGYASTKFLSVTPVGAAVTLADMLTQYPNFAARDMNVFAVGGYNVRTTPAFEDDNIAAVTLAQKTPVKVVARANAADADGILWYMIQCKDAENKDVFLFVSGKALTPDPDGKEAPLLLEDLLALYTGFTAEESTKTVTGEAGANCYSAPSTTGTKALTLAKGASVTVVAKGTANGAEWYVIRTESGLYYFAGATLFG